MSLPAAEKRYGVVGFCWGGGTAFASAVASPPGQGAAVVYYGTSPATASLANVKVPVLGLYGGDDERVGATVPPADSAMKALGKRFEPHTFPGAGHGFLRQQDGKGGANLAASKEAWPLTISFFRSTLGR
jgi:carboxymethylenebutenolidase